ncbi:MAG TPA: MinD/ParA family protein [Candidatus Binatia bacterium]|nr:MinD/ParA family protein [Candidatus Binatia bacterium]
MIGHRTTAGRAVNGAKVTRLSQRAHERREPPARAHGEALHRGLPRAAALGTHARRAARTIAVASGKGGVGKSNVVANVAIALARRGQRVVVLDADLGLANIDALLGLEVRATLREVLAGSCRVADTIVEGPAGVRFVPAASGYEEMTRITPEHAMRLLEEFEELEAASDFVLVDTAAGISANVLFFAAAAHEALVVLTPEPTSLTDAYALVKVLATRYAARRLDVLVNLARDRAEAERTFGQVARVAERFLGVDLRWRGWVPWDAEVGEAVRRQRALLEFAPASPAARALDAFAAEILRVPAADTLPPALPLFRGLVEGGAS